MTTCDHRPNAAGTRCELCNLPAEPDNPDDFADALVAVVETLYAQVPGQMGWAD